MSLKRKVNGKWVSIAGPSTSSNNSKAVNVSLTDSAGFYDTSGKRCCSYRSKSGDKPEIAESEMLL